MSLVSSLTDSQTIIKSKLIHLSDKYLKHYQHFQTVELCSYGSSWWSFVVQVWSKQNLVDLMEDPVNADVIAVCHISIVDEDAALKIFIIQTFKTKGLHFISSTSLTSPLNSD